MLYIHCFQLFSEVLNRFKYRHNACFRCTLFSSISLQFQIVSDTNRMHALETVFSFFSLQFQIVSNTFRAHALKKLCSKCFLQFQKYRHTACFRCTLFPLSTFRNKTYKYLTFIVFSFS